MEPRKPERKPAHKTAEERTMRTRCLFALALILTMTGAADLTGESEVLFPEMAALAIGMWIIDKRVWRIGRGTTVVLMTAGAVAGVCIVRYSGLPMAAALALAFVLAAAGLICTRTTLLPLLSACMLPVLLGTESWVYPLAVLLLTLLLVGGQQLLERCGLRRAATPLPARPFRKKELSRWVGLLVSILAVAGLALETGAPYLLLPPLIVTHAELVHSKAGFRNRPLQILALLILAASTGTFFQLVLHSRLGWPESTVALCDCLVLYLLFRLSGKFFAPAGAMALIPMIAPQEGLLWLPLQAAGGAMLFIASSLLFFHRCYRWPRAQLVYCLTPTFLRNRLHG